MARANKRGPRTAAGKIRSSLNALRHGLAATHRRQALPMQAIERLADAICGDGPDRADGALLAAARGIAENAFVLSTIRQQKIVVIERLKEATKIALRKGDNSLLMRSGHTEACVDLCRLAALPLVGVLAALGGPPPNAIG